MILILPFSSSTYNKILGLKSITWATLNTLTSLCVEYIKAANISKLKAK